MVELSEAEREKKRKEDNLRDLWDNVKHPNVQIIGVTGLTEDKFKNECLLSTDSGSQ